MLERNENKNSFVIFLIFKEENTSLFTVLFPSEKHVSPRRNCPVCPLVYFFSPEVGIHVCIFVLNEIIAVCWK